MTDILNIKNDPIFDDRIVKFETHMYNPSNTFEYSDEIRILSNRIYTYCYAKAFYMLKENRETERSKILPRYCQIIASRSCLMKFNGIDRNRNVGITSIIKNYSLTSIIRMTNLWLLWTLDGTLDPTQRKDTLIFAYRSTCCWTFARITNAWSSTLVASWYW